MWKPRTLITVAVISVFGLIAIGNDNPNTSVTSPTTASQSQPSETNSPQEEATAEPSPSVTQTGSPAPTGTEAPQEPDVAESVQDQTPSQDQVNVFTALLAGLTIEAEVTSGYDRDLFKHWIDADGDGCNAREEVLIIESLITATTGSGCSVLTGSWFSAYDALNITESSKLDIDHMIPLKEAWDSGANTWSADRRQTFANDLDLPQALIAVSAGSNRSKSARDPAEWLPTNISYRCQYVEDWMVVKTKWDLSVDAREFEALRSVSVGCVN